METLLRVENLCVDIPVTGGLARPVAGVDLQIGAGETYALVGESGSGKSMTALALMRLLPAGAQLRAGRMELAGADLLGLTEQAMRRVRGGRMAMIFQEPMLAMNPVLSVGRQVMESLRVHRDLAGAAARDAAAALLAQVGIADAGRRLGSYPFELSGGMRQRVLLAMALAGGPALLIADEPTTALDVTLQAQVLGMLRKLQGERGMAVLLITHDLGVVAENADQVGVMYAGELVETATREDFFVAPFHPYSRQLFLALPGQGRERLMVIAGQLPRPEEDLPGCRFAPRCPQAFARCRSEVPRWHVLQEGHRVRCHLAQSDPAYVLGAPVTPPARRQVADAPKVLRARGLSVQFLLRHGLFGRRLLRAVDGVDMDLSAGRTLALVGESGCGKTTVARALLGLTPATAGTVEVRGGMQMVFQDPYASLNPRMRIAAILLEGMVAQGRVPRAGRAAAVAGLLAEVGLPADAGERFPHEFSGGQRQRIAIARALAVRPRILICDEPTSALDVSVQAQIVNLLKALQEETALAYLFITHNLALVGELAHEVAVMYLGRIVEQGPMEEVLTGPRHPYTRALLAAAPRMAGRERQVAVLPGDPPSPLAPPPGCAFHPRCPEAFALCRAVAPRATPIGAGHWAACHLLETEDARGGPEALPRG